MMILNMDANGNITEYRSMLNNEERLLNRPEQKRACSECGQSGDRDRNKQGKAHVLFFEG
jgi:hypothetical protein